jgi:hypothetical protein
MLLGYYILNSLSAPTPVWSITNHDYTCHPQCQQCLQLVQSLITQYTELTRNSSKTLSNETWNKYVWLLYNLTVHWHVTILLRITNNSMFKCCIMVSKCHIIWEEMKATGRFTQNFSKPVGAQCGLTLQRKVGNITCHAEVAKTFSFGRINNNHH